MPVLNRKTTSDPCIVDDELFVCLPSAQADIINSILQDVGNLSVMGRDIVNVANNTIYFNALNYFLSTLYTQKAQTSHSFFPGGTLLIGYHFDLDVPFAPDLLKLVGLDPTTILVKDSDQQYEDGYLDDQPPQGISENNIRDLLKLSLLGYPEKLSGKANILYQQFEQYGLLNYNFTLPQALALQSMTLTGDSLVGSALCNAILNRFQPEGPLRLAIQWIECSNSDGNTAIENLRIAEASLFFSDTQLIALSQRKQNRLYMTWSVQSPDFLPIKGYTKSYRGLPNITILPACQSDGDNDLGNITILGTAGADQLTSSTTGNPVVLGGDGDDVLLIPPHTTTGGYSVALVGGQGVNTYQIYNMPTHGGQSDAITIVDSSGHIIHNDNKLLGIFICNNGKMMNGVHPKRYGDFYYAPNYDSSTSHLGIGFSDTLYGAYSTVAHISNVLPEAFGFRIIPLYFEQFSFDTKILPDGIGTTLAGGVVLPYTASPSSPAVLSIKSIYYQFDGAPIKSTITDIPCPCYPSPYCTCNLSNTQLMADANDSNNSVVYTTVNMKQCDSKNNCLEYSFFYRNNIPLLSACTDTLYTSACQNGDQLQMLYICSKIPPTSCPNTIYGANGIPTYYRYTFSLGSDMFIAADQIPGWASVVPLAADLTKIEPRGGYPLQQAYGQTLPPLRLANGDLLTTSVYYSWFFGYRFSTQPLSSTEEILIAKEEPMKNEISLVETPDVEPPIVDAKPTTSSQPLHDEKKVGIYYLPIKAAISFAVDVYDQEKVDMPEGYTKLIDCPPMYQSNDYFGRAYFARISDGTLSVVIAHRGTVISSFSNIVDDIRVMAGRAPAAYLTGSSLFSTQVQNTIDMEFGKNILVAYFHVGHSLGSIHAELCANQQYYLSSWIPNITTVFAYAFEDPGSLPILQYLVANNKINPYALSYARTSSVVYNADVDVINTCNEQGVSQATNLASVAVGYDLTETALLPTDLTYYLAEFSLDQHQVMHMYNAITPDGYIPSLPRPSVWPVGLEAGYDYYSSCVPHQTYWSEILNAYWLASPIIRLEYNYNYTLFWGCITGSFTSPCSEKPPLCPPPPPMSIFSGERKIVDQYYEPIVDINPQRYDLLERDPAIKPPKPPAKFVEGRFVFADQNEELLEVIPVPDHNILTGESEFYELTDELGDQSILDALTALEDTSSTTPISLVTDQLLFGVTQAFRDTSKQELAHATSTTFFSASNTRMTTPPPPLASTGDTRIALPNIAAGLEMTDIICERTESTLHCEQTIRGFVNQPNSYCMVDAATDHIATFCQETMDDGSLRLTLDAQKKLPAESPPSLTMVGVRAAGISFAQTMTGDIVEQGLIAFGTRSTTARTAKQVAGHALNVAVAVATHGWDMYRLLPSVVSSAAGGVAGWACIKIGLSETAADVVRATVPLAVNAALFGPAEAVISLVSGAAGGYAGKQVVPLAQSFFGSGNKNHMRREDPTSSLQRHLAIL